MQESKIIALAIGEEEEKKGAAGGEHKKRAIGLAKKVREHQK